jgi:hypothetical protein
MCSATFSASAQQSDIQDQNLSLPSMIASLGQPVVAAQDELTKIAISTANSQLDGFSSALLGDRLKYLSMSIGQDNGDTYLEGMAVYGFHETKNWFVFNQTSMVNYDNRTTLNIGIGARHINDDDTVILGVNAFHDLEFGSSHRRASIGGEVLTSLFQLRVNYYKGLTGEHLYEAAYEQALDGQDIKLAYELPYFYGSDIYFLSSQWYDGTGYRTSNDEFGVSAELRPNLMLRIAQNKAEGQTAGVSASITYSYTFGRKPDVRSPRDGILKFALEPIRNQLYKPVQRENRIKKSTTASGSVTFSTF